MEDNHNTRRPTGVIRTQKTQRNSLRFLFFPFFANFYRCYIVPSALSGRLKHTHLDAGRRRAFATTKF